MRSIFVGLLCIASCQGYAAESYWYLCQQQDASRKIVVHYAKPPATAPCEVRYVKADSQQTLWTAQNQENYCGPKADAFADKQGSWGWQCYRQEGSPPP